MHPCYTEPSEIKLKGTGSSTCPFNRVHFLVRIKGRPGAAEEARHAGERGREPQGRAALRGAGRPRRAPQPPGRDAAAGAAPAGPGRAPRAGAGRGTAAAAGAGRERAGHGGAQGGAAQVHLARLHRTRPRPQREGLQVPAEGKRGSPARWGAGGRSPPSADAAGTGRGLGPACGGCSGRTRRSLWGSRGAVNRVLPAVRPTASLSLRAPATSVPRAAGAEPSWSPGRLIFIPLRPPRDVSAQTLVVLLVRFQPHVLATLSGQNLLWGSHKVPSIGVGCVQVKFTACQGEREVPQCPLIWI